MQKLREWHDVDQDKFRKEIVALNQPAVLKSLVSDWPAVQQARKSRAAITSYLSQFDKGEKVPVLVGPPAIKGRFFYRDNLRGFNYDRVARTLTSTLKVLCAPESKNSFAIAMQAMSIADNLPGFSDENYLSLLDRSILPLMWLGNRTTTTTHYDTNENVACAVAGRRRITFFPPDQIANLYVGPLLLTPAGTPMSMVDLRRPDLSRYPKFEVALNAALQVDLEPGDAVYIPSFWWHNVESLDGFSMLVNYWWGDSDDAAVTPYHSLLHSLLSIPNLPRDKRKIWRDLFDYYVFQLDQNPADHLPEDLEDIIGHLSPARRKRLMERLSKFLSEETA